VEFTDQPVRAALEFQSTGMRVACVTSTMSARIAVERFEQRVSAGKKVRDKDIGRLARVFVEHVAYWNIRRESGEAVPRTVKGVLSLDRDDTLLPMLRQWAMVVASGGGGDTRDKAALASVGGDAAPDTVTAAVDPDEAILAAMEARTLTEPGDGEQLVTEAAEEQAPVLEPV
jgi:hypothetical protein